MTPETREALEKSIQHWERMASGNRQPDEVPGRSGCALCAVFWRLIKNGSVACYGCPVYKKTGKHGCRGTPYEAVSDFWADENVADLDTPEFRELAKAELEFLKSLLP